MLAVIEQSQYFKNQVTSMLAVNDAPTNTTTTPNKNSSNSNSSPIKKPPRSPVAVCPNEDEDMLKDVNDNIKAGNGDNNMNKVKSGSGPTPGVQWDFLSSGDSNNNNNNNNSNHKESSSIEQKQRSVEASGCSQKIGFIIEDQESTVVGKKASQSLLAMEVCSSSSSPPSPQKSSLEDQIIVQMEVVERTPPLVPVPSSPVTIDINCNNICEITDCREVTEEELNEGEEEDQVLMIIKPEATSSPSSPKEDLIDFDSSSPEHQSNSSSSSICSSTNNNNKDSNNHLHNNNNTDHVEQMFKLDEEEDQMISDQRRNEEEDKSPSSQSLSRDSGQISGNCSIISSGSSVLQIPDSPASVNSLHSTDADADSGCEASSYPNNDGSFSTPPSTSLPKRFKMSERSSEGGDGQAEEDQIDGQQATPLKSERSLSSESLNSEASMESNDSKSSLRLMNTRFSKNGTLERQTSSSSVVVEKQQMIVAPTGLQVLVLWNNLLTKKCSQAIADMIKGTSTLEVLNVGKNDLGNEFVSAIKASLCANESIAKLGLQSVHLTCAGAKTVAEVIEAKCASPLTRVDLRDNSIQVQGLQALDGAVKCNKRITQIDLSATPGGGPMEQEAVGEDVEGEKEMVSGRN